MFKLSTVALIITIIFIGCGEKKKDYVEKSDQTKTEHWANYDDYLDVKSKAKVDTMKLRQELNKILTPERIVYNFGPGYHNFYLALYSSPWEDASFKLNPVMSWADNIVEAFRPYYSEYKIKDIDIDPSQIKNLKSTDLIIKIQKKDHYVIGPIFNLQYDDTEKIFDVTPGKINNKTVRSVKFFDINIIVDENKKIIKPWVINEVDIRNFRTQMKPDYNESDFRSHEASIIFEDLNSLKKKIVFPEAALRRGVTGRVLMAIYIDEKGNCAGHTVIKGLGYGCEEAVINALKNAKFTPSNDAEKSFLYLPFDFGATSGFPVDLAVKTFEYNSNPKVYNRLKLSIENKSILKEKINTGYKVYVFVDGKIVFSNFNLGVSTSQEQNLFFFGGETFSPGVHQYVIYIDPEGQVNDINRDNNIIKGTFEVK